MAKSELNDQEKLDLKNQTQVLEGDVRTCAEKENAEFKRICESTEIHSLDQVIYVGLKESEDGPCLGKIDEATGTYSWLSYKQVLDRIGNLSAGLRYLALTGGDRYNFGIWMSNGFNSVISEYACFAGGLIVVPLDDNLTPHECASIINDLNIGCIIMDTAEKVQAVISQAYNLQSLKYIVMMGLILESYRSKALGYGITVKTSEEVHELGQNDPVPFETTKDLNNIAMIIHTNGTTGDPKRVMVSHRSILYNAVGINIRLGSHKLTKSDVMFSYLPRTQMDERCLEVSLLMAGGRIGFTSRDLISAWKEVKILKPTLAIILPKLVKILRDKLLLAVRGRKIQEWLLRRSLSTPLDTKRINNDAILRHIKSKMGGKIRLIIIATSHTPQDLMSFLRKALGCKICSSYGLKELSGPCTLSYPDDETSDHVGVPLPSVQIRLANQDQYSDGLGQIFIKKPAVVPKLANNNNPSVSPYRSLEEVWIRTDDVGLWRPNGTLELIGHESEIVKIFSGKLLQLEKIESILFQSQFVENLFIHGSEDKPLVALIFPRKEMVKIWCCEHSIRGNYGELFANKRLHEEILSDLRFFGRKYGLEPHQHVKTIQIIYQPFSSRLGLVNSVLGNRRKNLKRHFDSLIQAMN